MEFQKRKSAALAAINSPSPDKSPKGNIDEPIIPLLTAINSHPSYFTTSSCSGRISILSQPAASPSAAKKKARGGSWLLVSHEPVHPSSVTTLLFPSPADAARRAESPLPDAAAEQSVEFRFEPLIIAVECENVEAAQSLVSVAIACGFRESGITSVSKRTIIAIRCSIRLEVPLGSTQKLMVSPEYIEYLVDIANGKMETNRKRTDLFYNKLAENGFLGSEIRVDGEAINNGEKTCLEVKRFGALGSSEESEMEVLEGQLEPESKYNRNAESDMAINPFITSLTANKLIGSNYLDWKRSLDNVLTAYEHKFVLANPAPSPLTPESTEEQREVHREWHKADTMAKCYILASMSNDLQLQHQSMDTAAAIMLNLRKLFGKTDRLLRSESEVMRKLMTTQMSEGMSVCEHVLTMMNYQNEIESLGGMIDNKSKIDMILHTLPKSYENFQLNLLMSRKEYTWNELLNDLLAVERVMGKGPQALVSAKASSSQLKDAKKKGPKRKKTRGSKVVGPTGGVKKLKGKGEVLQVQPNMGS